MEANVVGLPWGWKEKLRDSCGTVAQFDFYVVPQHQATTKNDTTSNFFECKTFGAC